jgi:hypothetical protein
MHVVFCSFGLLDAVTVRFHALCQCGSLRSVCGLSVVTIAFLAGILYRRVRKASVWSNRETFIIFLQRCDCSIITSLFYNHVPYLGFGLSFQLETNTLQFQDWSARWVGHPKIVLIKVIHPVFLKCCLGVRNWGSSINIAFTYKLDDRGSIPGRGGNFSLSHSVQPGCEGPPSLLSSEHPEGSLSWVKRPGRDAGDLHSVSVNASASTHTSAGRGAEEALNGCSMFTF